MYALGYSFYGYKTAKTLLSNISSRMDDKVSRRRYLSVTDFGIARDKHFDMNTR